jgi:hypothetical protein
MLIRNIDTVIKYLGRAVNTSMTFGWIEAYCNNAENEYLTRVLGEELLEELNTVLDGTPTGFPQKLIEKAQEVTAWYGYGAYLPFSIGQDGDFGLQEEDTDKSSPVRIGVLDKRQREAAENASKAMERLLVWLYFNKNEFETWKSSDTYQQRAGLWIETATKMTKWVPQVANSYRLFETLMPYLAKTERDVVRRAAGAVVYDALLTKIKAGDTLDATEAKQVIWIERLIATQGYLEALPHLNIVQTGSGALRVLSDFDGIYNRKAVDGKGLQRLIDLAQTEARRSMNVLRRGFSTEDGSLNKLPDNSANGIIFRMK